MFMFCTLAQNEVGCLQWDLTGQLLASAAAAESMLKMWWPGEDSWMCQHTLTHPAPVTTLEWCPAPAKQTAVTLVCAR